MNNHNFKVGDKVVRDWEKKGSSVLDGYIGQIFVVTDTSKNTVTVNRMIVWHDRVKHYQILRGVEC